jgi:hypothetical protein
MKPTSLLLLALAASVPLSGPAEAQDAPAVTDEQLIASAEQGAPEALSNRAQIIVWEQEGMRVLREGTSGWWCMPDNPNSPAPDPLCGDANALEWLTALMERREPTYGKIGALYALLGGQIASNTDPFATEPPEGSDWITVPPFQGIVNDEEHIAGMVGSPAPNTSIPFVVWYDTPYAHHRQPLDWY